MFADGGSFYARWILWFRNRSINFFLYPSFIDDSDSNHRSLAVPSTCTNYEIKFRDDYRRSKWCMGFLRRQRAPHHEKLISFCGICCWVPSLPVPNNQLQWSAAAVPSDEWSTNNGSQKLTRAMDTLRISLTRESAKTNKQTNMYLGRQTTAKGKHQQLICGCIDGAIPTTKTLTLFSVVFNANGNF